MDAIHEVEEGDEMGKMKAQLFAQEAQSELLAVDHEIGAEFRTLKGYLSGKRASLTALELPSAAAEAHAEIEAGAKAKKRKRKRKKAKAKAKDEV